MRLRPTNVPLTVKEFDSARCGVCAGCGCYCGYIAYIKGSELVDLYGHPHDPNGIGSLCTKGMTLLQEMHKNPLRVREPVLRYEDTFKTADPGSLKRWVIENLKGKVAVFLDRTTTDLSDLSASLFFTEHVYSDALFLPFKASTLRPQEWRDQRFILSLECETVFSEVMSTRWLVDAFERSSYIVAVSSRYGTTSAKASKRLLLSPPMVVRFIEELALACEGSDKTLYFDSELRDIVRVLSLIKDSLILVGDTLLRSPWKNNVLDALRRIRRRIKVNYSIVGDVSPLRHGSLEEFLSSFEGFDSLLLTGNPARYMPDELLSRLKTKRVLHLSLLPNITANSSELVVPTKLFSEREFLAYRNGFGLLAYSPQVLEPPEASFSVAELLSEFFGVETKADGLLDKLGVSEERLLDTEGGALIELPLIEDWDEELETLEIPSEGTYLLCDNGLVDDMGHWNVWTHDIEREQTAYVNPATAERLGLCHSVDIRGVNIKLKLSSNIAENVIFVPASYEEFQPFDPGARPGRLLKNPFFRIEEYD